MNPEPATPSEIVLETDRLILRRHRATDAALQRELWLERDPRVPPHRQIDANGHPTLSEIETGLRRADPDFTLGLLIAELKERRTAIGYCGLIANAHGQDDEPELAYEFLRDRWGRGYATEASRAVLAWARDSGYRRLWATIRDWNIASRHVVSKLGFVETARIESDLEHGNSLYYMRDL
jgi:ribosomal-protein-alanine N-acetyltransferase